MDIPRMQDLARRVAKSVSREWPGIEADDIEQEIMLHVLERARWFNEGDYSDGAIYRTMERVALRYASRERYRYTFNSAQYVYLPSEIRALLAEAFFDPIAWENAPRKEDYRLDVASGGIVVSLWDLREAFDTLKEQDRQAITKKCNAITTDGIGYKPAPLTPAEQKRYERAIDSITEYLNRKVSDSEKSRANFNGPGSRKVISNAAAIAKTKEVDAA